MSGHRNSAALRRTMHRVFSRQYGLTLHMDAVAYLESFLHGFDLPDDEIAPTLDLVAQTFRRHHGPTVTVVAQPDLALIVQRLQNNTVARPGADGEDGMDGAQGDMDEVAYAALVHVVSAVTMPRWRYAHDAKAFVRDPHVPSLLADAPSKPRVHSDRFDVLRQRILRNPHFRPAAVAAASAAGQTDRMFSLTSIASMRGCENEQFILFGMLSRLDDDAKVFLEDMSGVVELDLSRATISRGFYTETCIVVVDGVYTEDRVFQVSAMAMPPPETKEMTIEAFGQLDFLGAPPDVYDEWHLARIEKNATGVCMMVLSDVFLDQPHVMSALRKFLTACNDQLTPLVLVLCGNFTSTPSPPAVVRDLFAQLAALLSAFPTVCAATTLVLVPGPHDPPGGPVMPRMPLPKSLTGKLATVVSRVVWATAPCRIKYCSQEIVIVRENLMAKLFRNAVAVGRGPTGAAAGAADEVAPHELPYHLARTLVDQAHLCPLPVHVAPVAWDLDHALRLYPAPDVVVVADRAEPFHEQYEGVHVVNPGPFASNGFGFAIYEPATKEVKLSHLPRD
ncbi:DNA-directed DNA polymerase epsilon, subunit B [Allomyces javanicus]|nr:DNA-directed DNA polymerase epsilon, subunit B [Allomyces javanicus]